MWCSFSIRIRIPRVRVGVTTWPCIRHKTCKQYAFVNQIDQWAGLTGLADYSDVNQALVNEKRASSSIKSRRVGLIDGLLSEVHVL